MTQETFERELARRADEVHGAPLTFDVVSGRARQIRRRRRTAVVAGVAAAVAAVVLVPTALSGGGHDRAPEPAPAPTVPGAAVLHDGVVTLPGGGTVPVAVDNADVTQMSVLVDGRIVLALQEPYGIQVYRPDGALEARYPVRYNVFATSARDDVVAWVAKDLSVQVLSSGTTEPSTWPRIPRLPGTDGNISAVLDADHLLIDDGTTTSVEMTADGETDLATSEPFRVTDVSPDGSLWAVTTVPDVDSQFGCGGLYDPESAALVARSCDVSGLRFSPDGEHLLSVRGDNNMAGEVKVVDRDLRTTDVVDTDVISRVAWDDSAHVLVAAVDLRSSQWSLTRLELGGGDPEIVVPPSPGGNPEIMSEFTFSE
ncbi:hypothetical protein [Nocardioides mangrovi]|uniref:WD40 repeat domain-containing protein n=1 Tax=Nocardioides mangrovi TaxID=2874580 RepID=A0ABS7UA84_9ACTN|nr:hypothetical protein [Nocardioides mangrovi]MBZ5737562.1 hypothetical protein [Nocardioides mangrovi]